MDKKAIPKKKTKAPLNRGTAVKYKPSTVKIITDAIRKDTYTVIELCNAAGITPRTYQSWVARYPEFAEAITEAKADRAEMLLALCSRSLRRLIEGYRVVEVQDEERPNGTVKITRTKYIAPNLGAIIHFQTNQDPDNWTNSQKDNDELLAGVEFRIRQIIEPKKETNEQPTDQPPSINQ